MSQLDQLLDELCPDGVRREPLGSVGSIMRGKRFVKADMVSAGVPCMHYGEIYTRYGISAEESFSFLNEEQTRSLRFANPGDVIMVSAGESVEDIGKSVAWLGAEPIVIHDACYAFSSSLDPRYVSYYFSSRLFRDQIRSDIASSKISSVSTQSVSRALIPVPPLAVQLEIVRILDHFTELQTELTTELEAELEARKMQYESIRDSVLLGVSSSRTTFLSEVAAYVRGVTYTKSDEVRDQTDGHRILRANNINLGSNRLDLDDVRVVSRDVRIRADQQLVRDDVLMATASGSRSHVGKVAYIEQDIDFSFGGFMAVLRPISVLRPRFLFHLLASSKFANYLDSVITSTTINNLNRSIVGSFPIPLPDVAEQDRIVEVLDSFDGLVNDLNVGLRAELAARRKQYEYYRDSLLTFEEAPA